MNDSQHSLSEFYANQVFVSKVSEFLQAILASSTLFELKDKIHPKSGIQHIDPRKNESDRSLCKSLGWMKGKIYRVDYGNTTIRLLFGLDSAEKRCHILALDANHRTLSGRKR